MRSISLFVATGTAVLTACSSSSSSTTGSDGQFDLTCNIPVENLFFGGVARDGIPALTVPEFVNPGAADVLGAGARVLGVAVDGEARAYPLGILWWHEVVNDVVGSVPVLLTYCPLTGSGIAFDPFIDGVVRNFGVSGLLHENNLIMFDRQTETLWNQMLLGGTCGLDRGKAFELLPIVETTWGHWKAMYPNTTVITTNTGFVDLPYGSYPYGNYDAPNNRSTLFPSSPFSSERPPKELVLGVQSGTNAVAYPFGELAEAGDAVALNETFVDTPILVTYTVAENTALAFDRRVNGQELTFTVADSVAMTLVDAETGTTWSAAGEALSGPLADEGARLTQLADAYVVFWFAWSIYHANTEIFR